MTEKHTEQETRAILEFEPDAPQRFRTTGKLTDLIVGIKGAGEMASGVACSLYSANIRRIFMMEIPSPLAVRRTVSFCESIHTGSCRIEGVEAVKAVEATEISAAWDKGAIAVLPDPEWRTISRLRPDVVIDATLAKVNLGTTQGEAILVIGLGPGFKADEDVHLVIETHRGHDLGRIITRGSALPNTGVPGNIGGHTIRRVLRAPCDGLFETRLEIGAVVEENQVIGRVGEQSLKAKLSGVLRGLIHTGTRVTKGLKLGDIDPRGEVGYCHTISDKARTLGRSVLEAVLSRFNRTNGAGGSLADALGLPGRGVVSLIGAGGKTSLMFRLAKALVGAGHTVLTTTTTKIFLPDKEQSSHLVVASSADRLLNELEAARRTAPHISAGATVDRDAGKLIGFGPEIVDRVWRSGLFDAIIVEADGSRQLPFKASAEYEPVMPLSTSHLVHVTGLDAVGHPVADAVHRADIFSKNLDLPSGALLTESILADGILLEVQKADQCCRPLINTVVLNKADTIVEENHGRKIAGCLVGHGVIHRLAVTALKEEEPVKFHCRLR